MPDWDGDSLEISKISRLDMGAYLCIASNGVGGVAVSKRIKVSVDCKYFFIFLLQFLYYRLVIKKNCEVD